MCGSQNSCWRWELKRHFVGTWTWTTRKSVVRRWKSKDDNVDKLFVKELQTIPLILKLYIWDNSHYTSTFGQSCWLTFLRCKYITTGDSETVSNRLQRSVAGNEITLSRWFVRDNIRAEYNFGKRKSLCLQVWVVQTLEGQRVLFEVGERSPWGDTYTSSISC